MVLNHGPTHSVYKHVRVITVITAGIVIVVVVITVSLIISSHLVGHRL
jgi:hypothetical protein